MNPRRVTSWEKKMMNVVQDVGGIDDYVALLFARGIIKIRASGNKYRSRPDLKEELAFVYQQRLSGVVTSARGPALKQGQVQAQDVSWLSTLLRFDSHEHGSDFRVESHTKDPNFDLLILCLLSFYSCLKVIISINVILYSIYKMAGRALDS